MKNLKKKFRFRIHLKSKHLLVIMTFFCGSAVVATLASGITSAPLQEAAGMIVVPFEKSITTIGLWLTDINKSFQEKQDLIDQNEELKNTVDTLTEQNNILIQNQSELSRLQELYDLDAEYSDYPKVAARIISKDPGNWYDTFMINKGSKDGIKKDMNVIAGNGLVGIVYDVSSHTAKVRTIINDTSMVSAMFLKTNDACIVNGSLDTMEDGYLEVVYISKDAKVKNGDELVTSYVSSKFNEGITIGKVSDLKLDSTKLTKTARVTPVVDFKHLKEVLVITDLKKTKNLDEETKE